MTRQADLWNKPNRANIIIYYIGKEMPSHV